MLIKSEGIEQVRILSAALTELKIPIGRILSSSPCRNQETARSLALGPVELTRDLNADGDADGVPVAVARRKRLNESPKPGTNTILVSHVHGGKDRADWMHLELAEVIVFRPGGERCRWPGLGCGNGPRRLRSNCRRLEQFMVARRFFQV